MAGNKYKRINYAKDWNSALRSVSGAMAAHEKTCRKNPNVRPLCWSCRHFDNAYGDKEEVTFITFDAWAGEYPHKADMKPSKCLIDGCKLYNRIGVHCEELEIALQDEGWRLCPTVSEGCPDFDPWPEYKEDIDSILRGCV